ncbi:uncharacterized mitochondrial protein AtMg00310-like [Juglans microcarpa x Juglans regia]|uniref:uncharacterized mitochondrial protein AtMg00310-like n=1 Tax=Juglans microcarpa x Juglans regia TaxID=2249226 RepID=UPI001B7D9802|nr:uncharacterized mitochondrial protein AtMg00310-like [Juglans microcarpa x Juglans regia]
MKHQSQASKEILIKAVLQSIPTYSMGVFKLPKAIDEELNKLTRQYWWVQQENKGRINWCPWNQMKSSKIIGGLGSRDLEFFNMAMLAKQGWRLVQNSGSLAAKIISTKYYPNGNFLQATIKRIASYIWRSIHYAEALLETGLMWHIGNGRRTRI